MASALLGIVLASLPLAFSKGKVRVVALVWLVACSCLSGFVMAAGILDSEYTRLRDKYSANMPVGFLHEFGALMYNATGFGVVSLIYASILSVAFLLAVAGWGWYDKRGRASKEKATDPQT